MAGDDVELIQFAYSPYNEKARWALDLKGIAHRRTSLLPGPHKIKVRKLTGQTQTPVLVRGGAVIWGSAHILEALERWYPAPPILPADPAIRRAALEIEARFDNGWTPRIRRAVLDAVIGDPAYMTRLFGSDASHGMRVFYRAVLPVAKGIIRRGNGINGRESVEDGYRATMEALDFVAEQSSVTGYLAGGTFSVADLTAASALAATANPDHPDMKRPEPVPPRVRAWIDRWTRHPGAVWVRGIYARHRPLVPQR